MAASSDSSPSSGTPRGEAAVSPAYPPYWGPFQAQVAIRRRHLAFYFYIWHDWVEQETDKRWEEYEDAQGAWDDFQDYRQLRLF